MSEHGFFQITQKAFIRNGNKLLVMKDKVSGVGDLPGGRMNQDEFFSDWLDSLKRELSEELGNNFIISIKPDIFLVHKHRVNIGNFPCVIIGYHADYISGEIEISNEHDYFEWVDIDTYKPETLFSEYMLDAVRFYLKGFKNDRIS
jgi:8-oxo-dGTP pyrophosphatase MutT (NUDIX family)